MTIRSQAKLSVLQHISLTAIKCEYYKLAISHYNMDTEVPYLNNGANGRSTTKVQLKFNEHFISKKIEKLDYLWCTIISSFKNFNFDVHFWSQVQDNNFRNINPIISQILRIMEDMAISNRTYHALVHPLISFVWVLQ